MTHALAETRQTVCWKLSISLLHFQAARSKSKMCKVWQKPSKPTSGKTSAAGSKSSPPGNVFKMGSGLTRSRRSIWMPSRKKQMDVTSGPCKFCWTNGSVWIQRGTPWECSTGCSKSLVFSGKKKSLVVDQHFGSSFDISFFFFQKVKWSADFCRTNWITFSDYWLERCLEWMRVLNQSTFGVSMTIFAFFIQWYCCFTCYDEQHQWVCILLSELRL